jgi:NADPH-dependent 7-cyano-7-deazaguanine reductase QueF
MDSHTRRSRLATAQNPEPRLDYIVSLRESLEGTQVLVSYVPDRSILVPDSFGDYLSAVDAVKWRHLEVTAATILGDLNNELVARWVQVALSRVHHGEISHRVTVEDRQPKWDNPGLLSRLILR